MATNELPPPERLQIPVPCDGCKTGAPGKHYCTICKKTMCNNCNDIHANLLKDHQVVRRSEIASSDMSICGNHQDENLSRFCIKCHRPVCIECMTEQHNGHKVVKLSAVVEEKKLVLQKQISDVDQRELTRLSTAFDDLQAIEDKNEEAISKRRREINTEAEHITTELDKIKSAVENVRQKKLHGLTELEKENTTKFNNLREKLTIREEMVKTEIAEKERRLDRCQDNPVDFLQFVEMKISLSIQHTTVPLESSPKLQPVSNSTINISEILRKLDLKYISIPASLSLKVVEPRIISSFKAEIKGAPSLCITGDGHAWIGGYNSRELIKVDVTGKILDRKKVNHRIKDMSIVSSGNIVNMPNPEDSQSVIRLGTDGTETVIYDAASSEAISLSVTHGQEILICAGMGRLVKCNRDGTDMQTIYNKGKINSTIYSIGLPDKTICVSDWTINGLVVLDQDGQQIATITQPLGRTNYKPYGLACDRMGNILSADYNNDCVYIIDQNRHVEELMRFSHGIRKPVYVDIDTENTLWISQFDRTITVVKYLE